jgi:hypothetical protein
MVTRVTEQPPDSTGLVTVIDCQVSSWPDDCRSSLTDKASAVLGTKNVKILLSRNTELLLDCFPSRWAVIQWLPRFKLPSGHQAL